MYLFLALIGDSEYDGFDGKNGFEEYLEYSLCVKSLNPPLNVLPLGYFILDLYCELGRLFDDDDNEEDDELGLRFRGRL